MSPELLPSLRCVTFERYGSPPMGEPNVANLEALLRTLDDAALEQVVVPSRDAIHQALERSREQYRKASEAPRPSAIDARRRYR